MHEKIKKFLTTISFDNQYRGDCPNCGGSNSFSATKLGSDITYHCFRASCKIRGVIKKEMSGGEVVHTLEKINSSDDFLTGRKFNMPDHWCSPSSTHLRLVRDYDGVLDAYSDGRLELRYDPKQDRLVFLNKYDGVYYGAVGRSLNFRNNPKWFNYHATHEAPLVVHCRGTSKTGIVVEDAISAAVVSSVVDGISLLGTNLFDSYIPYMAVYDTLIVALDKDASNHALDIQKRMTIYSSNVYILLLERDIKYEKKEFIRDKIDAFSKQRKA